MGKKILITVETRGDTIYVSSKDVPGLWLWGKDPEKVFRNIAPAIQALYKHNLDLEVDVREARWSRIMCWVFVRLMRVTSKTNQSKTYPYLVSERHFHQAHG